MKENEIRVVFDADKNLIDKVINVAQLKIKTDSNVSIELNRKQALIIAINDFVDRWEKELTETKKPAE